MSRELSDHVIDEASAKLIITATDEPGHGGACHEYIVDGPTSCLGTVRFQNGPIAENGINGITQEALLAIVADRLRSFQLGPFPSKENAVALTHVETALLWLHKRTLDRVRRGVEGKSIA